MIYFTADLHFRHDNILRHCNRPFGTVDEMDDALARNWNKTVKQKDEVFIIGDFTMKGSKIAMSFLRQLNGRKYLIRGNHDQFLDHSDFDNRLFEWVKDYHVLKWQDFEFILFHFPILSWHKMRRNSIHLHGHIHANSDYNLKNIEDGIKRYDVGVDANAYKPVSIEDIVTWELMK